MTPTEAREQINRILQTLDDFPADGSTWTDDDEAILVWEALEELTAAARMICRAHSSTLAKRLPRDYTHPTLGPLHTETETSIKWDGNAVLSALSGVYRKIDPETGEMVGGLVDAVPTATLRAVVPAVGPNQTSSKWNKTGLIAAGLQPTMYSHTDYGSKLLKRGPRYRPSGARTPGVQ